MSADDAMNFDEASTGLCERPLAIVGGGQDSLQVHQFLVS
jgi:hypothetical protein